MPEKAAPKEGDEKVAKKGALSGKNRWWLIGGLGVIAVLVFFFVTRSNQNAQTSQQAQGATGMDPTTQAALQGAVTGAQGPAGPAGPEGPAGPAGKRGPPGPAGRRHHRHHHDRTNPGGRMQGTSQFATVRPGDTLGSIASRNGTSAGALYHQNRSTIGSTPTITPGMRLRV